MACLDDDQEEFHRRLEAARAGELDQLGQILMQFRAYLLLVADRELGDDIKAKIAPSDLVQETFLEAQRDFTRFQGDRPDELIAWLCRIQRNNVANFGRAFREAEMRAIDREVGATTDMIEGGGVGEIPTPSEMAVADERSAAVKMALGRLPEHYQRVLRFRYDEEMTFGQIGAAMGCSAEAARKLWARAVDHLQKELPDDASR